MNENASIEIESVSLAKNILAKHRCVLPDLREMDKWPFIDGTLLILDDDGKHFGTLEAQVKTLRENHNHKYPCAVDFISYCKHRAGLPVILLCVDNFSRNIFWLHFSRDYIKNLAYMNNESSYTIYLEPTQVINDDNKDYINRWRIIASEHIRNVHINHETTLLPPEICKKLSPIVGKKDIKFENIHRFLDKLNHLLDHDFPIVKSRFLGDFWKVGFAYEHYSNDSVWYGLFPISYDDNDVQIKEMDAEMGESILARGIRLNHHYHENPIDADSFNHAIGLIKEYVFELLKYKFLHHNNNLFLIRECIFAFLDKFSNMALLEDKDVYSLKEIKSCFFINLPIWIEEAHKEARHNFRQRDYIDPISVWSQLHKEQREKISFNAEKRISNNDKPTSRMIIGSKNIPFKLVDEAIYSLERMNIKNIERVYKKKDYTRTKRSAGRYWNVYSPKDLKFNMKIFFSNLSIVVDTLIEDNFPLLKNESSFFDGFNKIVVFLYVKESCDCLPDSPTYDLYCVVDGTAKDSSVEVYYFHEIQHDFEHSETEAYLVMNDMKYRIITSRRGILRFLKLSG